MWLFWVFTKLTFASATTNFIVIDKGAARVIKSYRINRLIAIENVYLVFFHHVLIEQCQITPISILEELNQILVGLNSSKIFLSLDCLSDTNTVHYGLYRKLFVNSIILAIFCNSSLRWGSNTFLLRLRTLERLHARNHIQYVLIVVHYLDLLVNVCCSVVLGHFLGLYNFLNLFNFVYDSLNFLFGLFYFDYNTLSKI